MKIRAGLKFTCGCAAASAFTLQSGSLAPGAHRWHVAPSITSSHVPISSQIRKHGTRIRCRMASEGSDLDRRKFLSSIGATLAAILSRSLPASSYTIEPEVEPVRKSPRPHAYRIDFNEPPVMVPYPDGQENKVIKALAEKQLVFLGDHPNGDADHRLAATIIARLNGEKKGKLILGLDQVQQRFQPALDAYSAALDTDTAAAEAELRKATEWDNRGAGPFESYLPVLRVAKELKVPLVAVGVEIEAIARVESAGLEGLTAEERNQYVIDLKGFIEYERIKGFTPYAEENIFPQYEELLASGAIDKKITKPSFFAARILGDEGVASKCVETISAAAPGTTMVILQDLEHVRFGFGSSGRAKRIAASFGGDLQTATVMLNPTPGDTLGYTTYLRLSLALGDDLFDGFPVANFVWFSVRPLAKLLTHLTNSDDYGAWYERVKLGFD